MELWKKAFIAIALGMIVDGLTAQPGIALIIALPAYWILGKVFPEKKTDNK